MNRTGDRRTLTALIKKLREKIPNLTIRSTIMVGFPTETDDEFAELIDFINEAQMDYVGFFAYSREDGTPSYKMKQVSSAVKKARLKIAEITQSKILDKKNRDKIGAVVSVVCDKYEDGFYICRTACQSPEVDPCVLIAAVELVEVDGLSAADRMEVGAEYRVKITGVKKHNLTGVVYE
jgi:ribosomal protein S12 methylthiotransferase